MESDDLVESDDHARQFCKYANSFLDSPGGRKMLGAAFFHPAPSSGA